MNGQRRRHLSSKDKALVELFKAAKGAKDTNLIPEGDKVKLNYERITSRPDYYNKNPRYIDFIEKHKNDIMTVEFDPNHKKDSYLVCLKEDTSPIKWLWLVTDLIKVENKNV